MNTAAADVKRTAAHGCIICHSATADEKEPLVHGCVICYAAATDFKVPPVHSCVICYAAADYKVTIAIHGCAVCYTATAYIKFSPAIHCRTVCGSATADKNIPTTASIGYNTTATNIKYSIGITGKLCIFHLKCKTVACPLYICIRCHCNGKSCVFMRSNCSCRTTTTDVEYSCIHCHTVSYSTATNVYARRAVYYCIVRSPPTV